MRLRLPIGYDNFGLIIENKLDIVDKSLFIKDLFDAIETQIAVIIRPRRFGKSLNLSMLQHFLAEKVYGRVTKDMFGHLKIAKLGDEYMQHQGKYPVIYVTFKDVKDHSYEVAYGAMGELIRQLYSEHRYVLNGETLDQDEKAIYEAILGSKAEEKDIRASLRNLTEYLQRHFGVAPWLLIDEYDTPIQSGYLHGYYNEIIDLMRAMFGAALKTNPFLNRAVVTGILRVAKESLFSGLNNVAIYSLLHKRYGEYFGFTETEIEELIKAHGLDAKGDAIKSWYNGYRAGDTTIYNPWSVVNCLVNEGELMPYSVNTSDNQLIRNLLLYSPEDFKDEFTVLLQGQSVEQVIDESMVFGDLKRNKTALWSLLLLSGYLKIIAQRDTTDGKVCSLQIPNLEVRELYQRIIKTWLAGDNGIMWFNRFLNALWTGDMRKFSGELKELMENTASHHDFAKAPEAFYHGFLLGVTASLYYDPNYQIKSNRESGYGRYDLQIYSKDPSKLSLLLEFKKVDKLKNHDALMLKLEETAKEALEQIEAGDYAAELMQHGCKNILKVGLAFCGKHFKLLTAE